MSAFGVESGRRNCGACSRMTRYVCSVCDMPVCEEKHGFVVDPSPAGSEAYCLDCYQRKIMGEVIF